MTETEWRDITGYKYPYRISREGTVQVLHDGKWIDLRSNCYHQGRKEVFLTGTDGIAKGRSVFRLLDDAYNGGYAKKNGLLILPKNGDRQDCRPENIKYATRSEVSGLVPGNRHPVICHLPNGDSVAYKSKTEAARAVGLKLNTFCWRLKNLEADPRGYRWEVER